MTTPEKKGLWGSLKDAGSAVKGAFVEDVPDANPTASPAKPANRLTPIPAAPAEPIRTRPAIDQAARERLEAAVAEQAPPGYVEIQETLSTLAESIPDEGSRWKAALKLAAKHGHSVDALLGDFDKCIGILEQKERQFADETQAQIKKKVGGKQTHIEALDAEIKSKQEQIQLMQQEIAQLSEQRGTEAATMAADEQKILSVKESFDVAYEAVHAQLVERRNKLSSFGKVSS